ncbi:MAG: endonuclease/exonuclease/phosphatase family protein, partial [Syntrophales bacterium]|nr:endonuclease/exonuclease/phosphatase family protein [Syntrophales bacterium]
YSLVITANFYFVLRWFSDDRILIVRLCNYFLPWLGIVVAVNMILSTFNKKWLLAALNILPLTIITVIYAPLFINCACGTQICYPTLKVMSYNVNEYNGTIPEAAALIKQETPNILLLQEIEAHNFDLLIKSLQDLYKDQPLHLVYHPDMQQAVLSRYPLRDRGSSAFKNRLQKIEADTPYGPITVLNIHSYKFGWIDRHKRMESLLRNDVLPEKSPVILGGDFNTNDQSQTYDMISEYLNDSFRQVGCGFGFTYPAFLFIFSRNLPALPIIRIDHIFYSSHFSPIKAHTLDDSGGSDHYAVVAELSLLQ